MGARAQVTVTIGQNFTGSDNSQTYITPGGWQRRGRVELFRRVHQRFVRRL